jgi:RNA polymerase subunit RPABC4/transcription elongation factor Spt4
MFNLNKYNISKYLSNKYLICSKCNYLLKTNSIDIDCPKCHSHIFKVSFRGNFPRISDPDQAIDPYKRKKQEDGGGWESQMRPGDEDLGGGFGTRFRGHGSPTDFEEGDDYEKQRENDIPNSTHMFLNDTGDRPLGEGVNDGTFYDEDSPFATENQVADKLNADKVDVIGPHNMQTLRGIFDRVRSKKRGY